MKTYCIMLTDIAYRGNRRDQARVLRRGHGVQEIPFWGLDATRLGIHATHHYELDESEALSSKVVGTWLSHRALWAACLLDPVEDEFFILEDDALFPADWRLQFALARLALPKDWDVLNVGPCCVADKHLTHVAGLIYTVAPGAMCMHAYLIRRPAMARLVEVFDRVGLRSPVDITVMLHAAELHYYITYPRIIHQFNLPELAK